jgi:hypothetical protein
LGSSSWRAFELVFELIDPESQIAPLAQGPN